VSTALDGRTLPHGIEFKGLDLIDQAIGDVAATSAGGMKRVRVYIDGFNIYHAIDALKKPALKWLNHRRLAESFLRSGERLDEVHFFTAVLRWDAAKQKRHVNYLAALRAVDVRIHESRFTKVDRKCKAFGNTCAFHEEKQTDVGIAVKMVSDAMSGRVDRLILLTADSDQIPTAKFIRSLSTTSLTLMYPPNRGSQSRFGQPHSRPA